MRFLVYLYETVTGLQRGKGCYYERRNGGEGHKSEALYRKVSIKKLFECRNVYIASKYAF